MLRAQDEQRVHTDGLWSNQVAEDGGEQDEHHWIGDPNQVPQWDISPQLSKHPFIS